MKTLLIEGWRGINHSYALVNQNQILHLARIPDLRLFHRDMPFPYPGWNRADNDPGFTESDRHIIDGLQEPVDPGDRVDVVYRICSPFRATQTTGFELKPRTVTFMAVEYAFGAESFSSAAHRDALLSDDGLIVTPSTWCYQRIVEGGFPPSRVEVLPLGVDANVFRRLDTDARSTLRARLGIAEDEFVFLNIGAPFWYKGIDLLLCAFAVLKQNGLKVRLIVKDQSALYGLRLSDVITDMGQRDDRLRDEGVLSAIMNVPANTTARGLSNLLSVADCYLSPYRAEGFNLPVLEAIACGVPTIVTAGGATDDFCNDVLSIRLPGRFQRGLDSAGMPTAYIEPDFHMLVDAMLSLATGSQLASAPLETSRTAVVTRHDWGQITHRLMELAFREL